MTTFAVVSFFIFGSLIGSFLNVVILRLPFNKSLSGRSSCPSCGYKLAYYDLVPIFSYLVLGGKCRKCRKTISPRYFFIELATGACFALAGLYLLSFPSFDYLSLIRFFVAISFFVAIFVIDLEHFIILDKLLILGSVYFVILNFAQDVQNGSLSLGAHSYLAGGVLAGLVACAAFFCLWYFSSGKWMGFGDVKLVFLLGLILGWPEVLVMLLLAFWLGALVSLPLLALRKKQLHSALPFGTFLTLASFITMFYGKNLLEWYMKIIGWG